MVSLTGLQHKTIEQHVELGKSRIKRDVTDLEKLCSWFHQHDPFDVNEHSLRCISTGLTTSDDDCINCDRAEEIGKGIQLTLDGVSVAEATVKRSHQVRTLENLQKGIIIDKQTEHIDPMILFQRLILIVQKESDMLPYFSFELPPIPTSLSPPE